MRYRVHCCVRDTKPATLVGGVHASALSTDRDHHQPGEGVSAVLLHLHCAAASRRPPLATRDHGQAHNCSSGAGHHPQATFKLPRAVGMGELYKGLASSPKLLFGLSVGITLDSRQPRAPKLQTQAPTSQSPSQYCLPPAPIRRPALLVHAWKDQLKSADPRLEVHRKAHSDRTLRNCRPTPL